MFNTTYGDLVSVIIPSYNHEKFIIKALDSVFRQTYENVEILVIDDLSTDDSLLVVTDWAGSNEVRQRFTSIRILSNLENIGAHATINRGIDEAKGNVILVLNSDDLFGHTRIDKLIRAMEESKSGLAFSKVMPINENDTPLAEIDIPPQLAESFEFADAVVLKYPSLGFGFLENNLAISTGNLAIHKDLFSKIGKFRSLKYVHDWDFALRALLQTEPVYVPEPLYAYRLHGTNSFRDLANVKDIELDAMAEHFSDLVELTQVNNPLAPTSENWPYVFGLYVSELYLLRWNDFARAVASRLDKKLIFENKGTNVHVINDPISKVPSLEYQTISAIS